MKTKKTYIVFVYYIDELIHIEYHNTIEEAEKSVEEWHKIDKENILNYDLQEFYN